MNKSEIESYIKAGKIASEVTKLAKTFIKKDMLLIEIADFIENEIEKRKAKPAFPVNLSLNEIAAHYTPGLKDTTKANGILKVDLGVEVNGFIADTAFSVDLSDSKEFTEMIKLNEKALENALSKIKPGFKVKEIGSAIQETIGNSKFRVIKNLSGHSLGEDQIHAGLTISNYENNNETQLNDIAIAIEPFLTTGAGEVYESSNSEIYMLQKQGQVRDKDARKILEFIEENYRTHPFCKKWIEKAGFAKVNFSLSQLTQQEILHNYPVLIEKSKKPVSQAEHTVLITEKEVIVTTR